MGDETSKGGKFLWVGNDLSLDFVNTTPVLDGRPVDLLESFADLADWLVQAGRLAESERGALVRRVGRAAGGRLLEDARALRSALRSLFQAVVAGSGPPAGSLAAINGLLRRREAPELRYEGGTYVRAERPEPLDARAGFTLREAGVIASRLLRGGNVASDAFLRTAVGMRRCPFSAKPKADRGNGDL